MAAYRSALIVIALLAGVASGAVLYELYRPIKVEILWKQPIP